MGTGILYALLAANGLVALLYPWLGIVCSYVIAVMGPQYIWWWAFADVRPALWIALPTLLGFSIAVLRRKVSYAGLQTRLNAYMAVLWLTSCIAYYFGPYVSVVNEFRFYDADLTFDSWNKTWLAYLVGVILMDNEKKLRVFVAVILLTVIYLTYWANAEYFISHKFGRIHGPTSLSGQGVYNDENNFAVLFVVGGPFLYYWGLSQRRWLLALPIWAIIPMSWHAIFLTASRGALVATAAVLLSFNLRSRRRILGLAVLGLFAVAFVWEAGDVMKNRSATISQYEDEDSAASRLKAWEAATGMMLEYPFTGVGFASFGQAFPKFSDIGPRIAHNTFFQIGGEFGVIGACAYLAIIVSTLGRLWRNGNRLRRLAVDEVLPEIFYINEACLLGLIGFVTCALFLSLQQYEIFYFLLLSANATLVLSSRHLRAETAKLPVRPPLRTVAP